MRILIGYDGSSTADAAIEDLRRAGLPEVCRVVVLSVADVWLPGSEQSAHARPAVPADLPGMATIRMMAEQALDTARAHAAAGRDRLSSLFPNWQVDAEVSADAPAWSIIRHAEEMNADLVVVGSHGRGALGRAMLGSVSTRVLDELRTNVRIARVPRNDADTHILVAVDGSPDSDAAVQAVRGRTWPKNTKIRVVTAANWRLRAANLTTMPGPDAPVESWARHIADRAAAQFAGVAAEVSISVPQGEAKRVVLHEAESWNADCVFVGARGLTRAQRWLMGSVSTAVAMRAPCTVEVVRSRAV